MKRLVLCAALALGACTAVADSADNTDTVWRLISMNGADAPDGVTLMLAQTGRISGRAPCNSFFGIQSATFPAFSVEAVGATKMACPNLGEEAAFFAALTAATTATRSDDTLTLSDGTGPLLVFTADD